MLWTDQFLAGNEDGSKDVFATADISDRRGLDVVRDRAGVGADPADRSARPGALLPRAQAA